MPRKKEWPPRPHHHKPSGQERVRAGGKDYYLGPIGSAEARRRYAELVSAWKAPEGPPAPARGPTVAEAVAAWRRWAVTRYDPAGREVVQYDATLSPWLGLFADLPAAGFGVAQLERVRDEMVRRGWCRNVVNRRVVRVRTVWRWCERRGLAPAGAWAHLRSLESFKAQDRHVRATPPVQPAGWKDLARACRMVPKAVRDMLLVMWFAGMRSGEVRKLKAGDVDAETKTARLAQHKNAWRGQERVVVFGPRAWRVLSPRLEGKRPGDYVFPSGGGNRCYQDDSFARAVARGCARAGVSVTPYQCRHAFKLRVTRELGLDAARAAMGQKSILSTDRYASAPDAGLANEAARRVG
jgi:integrase